MFAARHILLLVLISQSGSTQANALRPRFKSGADFNTTIKPILSKYCFDCHSGDAPSGDVDFSSIETTNDVVQHFDSLERAVEHVRAGTMPPSDEPQPTQPERAALSQWYEQFVANIESRPAAFKPRRLSVTEYRNTLRTVFGFDLEVAIIEAEQTVSERSLVKKLLPIDPPGPSGFKNNTHRNRLTTVAWDQYSYLGDTAIERLFSRQQRGTLEAITGPLSDGHLEPSQAQEVLRTFLLRTRRRPVDSETASAVVARVRNLNGAALLAALQHELKVMLMSPAFIYRGLLPQTGSPSGRQRVDQFELAERLSYFLWADMPDERLMSLASENALADGVPETEVDRLLASPKAASMANVFAVEWFSLSEIDHVSNNPPQMLALKSQPIDFMNYLFTQNRPLLELVDSKTAFINMHTARMYGRDAKQIQRYVKPKGVEVVAVPNQQIQLQTTKSRGGILTMPGVLAMNKGPIQRGTWMLERILGEELPDPPPDVGQVAPNRGNSKLTFRERFEQHRSNASCAVCHDKIDPLGFVFETYDNRGRFINQKKKQDAAKTSIDTHGKLPSGEEFADIAGLRKILQTTQRTAVLRNIVRRTMSYALCRKLMIYDRPTVESITEKMDESNGTWRDLFVAIANSTPFREAVFD